MAWTQQDLDTISAAIASGTRSVLFADGRKVEYQDVGQMLQARNSMKEELTAAASQVTPRTRTTVARVVRGC